MRIRLVILCCLIAWSGKCLAEKDPKVHASMSAAQALAPDTFIVGASPYRQQQEMAFPGDSTLAVPKKRPEEPSFDPAGPVVTFGVGLIALLAGAFSATGILIAGGVFLVLGILLLVFYNKIKKINPFKVKGHNIVAKIILALFSFVFILALIGAIIMAFVVALTLLLAALLSSVVSPVVVAAVIIGGAALWMLIKTIVYLIKQRRYKRSLK